MKQPFFTTTMQDVINYLILEISFNFTASELGAKAYTYMGLSSTLYHLQEYEFALRCLLKAK